jgi:hypothetical protein
MGAALDSSSPVGMDVAAVFVYDRALSDAERGMLIDYLTQCVAALAPGRLCAHACARRPAAVQKVPPGDGGPLARADNASTHRAAFCSAEPGPYHGAADAGTNWPTEPCAHDGGALTRADARAYLLHCARYRPLNGSLTRAVRAVPDASCARAATIQSATWSATDSSSNRDGAAFDIRSVTVSTVAPLAALSSVLSAQCRLLVASPLIESMTCR